MLEPLPLTAQPIRIAREDSCGGWTDIASCHSVDFTMERGHVPRLWGVPSAKALLDTAKITGTLRFTYHGQMDDFDTVFLAKDHLRITMPAFGCLTDARITDWYIPLEEPFDPTHPPFWMRPPEPLFAIITFVAKALQANTDKENHT